MVRETVPILGRPADPGEPMRKRKVTYPVAKTANRPVRSSGTGLEPRPERPTVATIDVTAGAGRPGLLIGSRVRIIGNGLYSGEIAVIERFATGVIPSAHVRTESGKTRQVRTIDLEPVAPGTTTPPRQRPHRPPRPRPRPSRPTARSRPRARHRPGTRHRPRPRHRPGTRHRPRPRHRPQARHRPRRAPYRPQPRHRPRRPSVPRRPRAPRPTDASAVGPGVVARHGKGLRGRERPGETPATA